MNILTCFKLIADPDHLKSDDWRADNQPRVDMGFVRKMINPCDETALEIALRLRDEAAEQDQSVALSAVTAGDKQAERILKNLNALKFDRTVRIEPSGDIDFDPYRTANIICQYIRQISMPDIILTGTQAPPGDSGMVPHLIAETMGLPCMTSVTNVNWSKSKGLLEVTILQGNELWCHTVKPPVILALGTIAKSYLRIPTLKDRLAMGNKAVECLNFDYAVAENMNRYSELVTLTRPDNGNQCEFIKGENAVDYADAILSLLKKEEGC